MLLPLGLFKRQILLQLILSKTTEEKSIFVLFLSVFNHLSKLHCNSVSHSFEVLALLNAKNGHWVLAQSHDNPFVAKTLVSQIFVVSIFFQF